MHRSNMFILICNDNIFMEANNMATFVGAEYIIANVLIALKKANKKEVISLDELSQAGIYIQKMCMQDDIDAIFLSSSEQVANALYDFSDYFEYDKDSNSIKVVKTKNIDDLESRFLGYLPFNVLSFLVKMSLQFVNSNC